MGGQDASSLEDYAAVPAPAALEDSVCLEDPICPEDSIHPEDSVRPKDTVQTPLEQADREIQSALRRVEDPGAPGPSIGDHGPGSPLLTGPTPGGEPALQEAGLSPPGTGATDASVNVPGAGLEQETAAGARAQERTVPIRIEGAAWPGAGTAESLWDAHSHVFMETTYRSYVYQASDTAVTRPPSMQVTIEDMQAPRGGTAQFQAVIEGNPQPTVTWYKDSARLEDSAWLSQQQDGTTYSLVLRDVDQHDAGVYTCLARNAGGEVLCKAELLILGGESEPESESERQSSRRKLHSFYEVHEEIGRGVFGFLKRVQHKGNKMSCAAKFISLRSKMRAQAYHERDIVATLSHPLITKLLDQFETQKTLILILELCSSEELLDRLFKKSVMTEAEVKIYIQQLVEGLQYLHTNGILHLDIKPANILMVHPAREDIKICDFGFAQKITPSEPQYSKYGSPEFVPPEVIEQTPVSEGSDIWAMGVISYLSLTCSSPFAGESDRATLLNVREGRVSWSSPMAAHLSEDAKDFIKAALQRAPEARPSASQCLTHPWFLTSLPAEKAHFINTKQLKFLLARSRWQRSLMCYKSILVMRSIPELLQGPADSPSLGVSRHLLQDASGSSSSSSSDNEIAPYARAKSLPPSPVTHSPLLHPRGFLRPSASLPEEAEVCLPPQAPSLPAASPVLPEGPEVTAGVQGAGPPAVPGCVPRQSVIRSLFYQQAGEGSEQGCPPSAAGSRRHLARARRHLLKGGYMARALPGLREPLLEHRALEEAAAREEQAALLTKAPSFETALRLPSSTARVAPGRSRSLDQDWPRTTSPFPEEPGKSPEEAGRSPEEPGRSPEELGKSPEEPGKLPEEPGKSIEEPRTVPKEPGRSPEEPGRSPKEPGKSPEELRKALKEPGRSPKEPGRSPEELRKALKEPGRSPEEPGRSPEELRKALKEPGRSPKEPGRSPKEPGRSPKDCFEGQCPHPAPWGLGAISEDSSAQGPSPSLLGEPTATLHTGAWTLGAGSPGQAATGMAPGSEGSLQGSRLFPSTDGDTAPGVSQDSSRKPPTPSRHRDWGSTPQEGCGPPAAAAPQLPGPIPPRSHTHGSLGLRRPPLSGEPRASPSPAQASPLPGSKRGPEPSPSCSVGQALQEDLSPEKAVPPSPEDMEPAASLDDDDLSQETAQQRPQEQATTRKFSLECHGGYAGVAGYGTFAFGGDAGGMLGQGPLWAKMAWAQGSQSWDEQEEAVAESPLLLAGSAPVPEGRGPSPRDYLELTSWEDSGQGSQVSLVRIKDLSGDAEAADTLSLDISEVEPAYLNLSDLYDIKYLPFEFMIFRKVPKPSVEQEPPSPPDEAHEGLAELPEAAWPWPGELGPPASLAPCPRAGLQITEEEPEDMEALLGEAGQGGRRKASPSSRGFLQLSGGRLPLEEPQEHSLRERVKASVAHISRILTGRAEDPEKEGSRKKLGLASFRLKSKDRAPSFLKELSDETVVLGQPVTLACQVSAQPAAQATWSKDGALLEGSSRLLISSTLKHFQLLTILAVTAEDLGVYTCSVGNALGTATTTAVLRRAELPSSSPRPDIGEVYAGGVLLVWKPVETCSPVTYIVQCCLEGGSWNTLASDIFDCCYIISQLPRAGAYTFRTACVSKAGMGPYSSPSEQVLLGGPSHAVSEEDSGHTLPAQPLSSTQTFAFQTHIRRGRFSVVRQCLEKGSGRLLAAKIIPYLAEDKTAVLGEYEALKGLRHPHLVQLHGAYLSPRHLVLILELCSGPELLPCLAERASYSESEVKDYLWQTLSAAQYLHSQRILHLDLRSENLIVTEYNLLKVLDFGNAQSLSREKVLPSEKFKDYMETMAPELLEGQGAVPQTDVWAIGVTAFIMLSADYPVSSEGARDVQKALRKGLIRLSRCYAGLSGGAVAFLRSTLCANPWARPCASSCLRCPWLTEEGPANSRPTAVTFPTARLRAFVQEREKRRALLYKKHNLAQVR